MMWCHGDCLDLRRCVTVWRMVVISVVVFLYEIFLYEICVQNRDMVVNGKL